MDKRLEQTREFLKDTGHKSVINHLYNHSSDDEERIKLLRTAIGIYDNGTNLTPRDLQRLIDKFSEYKSSDINNPLAGYYLSDTMESKKDFADKVNSDRRKVAQNASQQVDDDEMLNENKIISLSSKTIDYELVELLKKIDKKAPNLEKIIGKPFKKGAKSTPKDWQDKIEKLLFLKELYSVRENISEILNGRNIDKESGYNQYREWLEETFKILKDDSYPDDEELQNESIRQEINNVNGRGLSDNRITKRLKILFKYKFEREISEPQIKGMVIYKNR